MYRRLNESTGNVLGYHLSGTITEAEVKEIQKEIEETIQEHGKARLLCQIEDLDLPEPEAVWEDLKFTPEYVKGIERFALVGEKRWQEWTATLSDKLLPAEVRYFENTQLDTAWAWIHAVEAGTRP